MCRDIPQRVAFIQRRIWWFMLCSEDMTRGPWSQNRKQRESMIDVGLWALKVSRSPQSAGDVPMERNFH